MEKPLVSVIVPAYQAEAYLPQCLESILNQSYENLQILLINDGSQDKTGEICDAYAQKDSRIQVFHKENGGVSSARNVGLSHATGAYIAFCDSDDTLRPAYLEVLVENALKHQCQVSYCSRAYWYDRAEYAKEVTPSSTAPTLLKGQEALCRMLQGNGVGGNTWCCLMARSLTQGLTFDTSLHLDEDYVFMAQVLSQAEGVCIDKTVLYNYYLNPKGLVRSRFNPKQLTVIRSCEKIQAFLEEKGLYQQMRHAMDGRFVVCTVLLLRRLRRDKALQKQYGPQLCKVIRQHLTSKSRAFLTRQVQIHALLAKLHYKLYFGVIDLKK